MREHLVSAITALTASASYFLLLDFARPALEKRQLVPVWWAILALYAILVFGIGFVRVIRVRTKLSGIGFLLLLATLFLYDPTINIRLKAVGLGWLWIASLIVGILWLLTIMKITLKDQQDASAQKPPE
jgi:hypothetical protein